MMENQSAPTPDAPLETPEVEQRPMVGFSQEDIWRLAYGLHSEPVRAYIRRRAERAAELPQVEPGHDANAHAADVIAGMDAYRTMREEAKDRVDRLLSKANLRYGSLHLAKNPELAAKVWQDALAQARTEGFNTSALEPGQGIVIPQPGPKAKRAHEELVAALKAHDRFMYSAKARQEAEAAPPDRWTELKEAIAYDLPLPAWVVEAAEQGPAPSPEEPRVRAPVPPAAELAAEPVAVKPVPEGWRARANRIWRRVRREIVLAPLVFQQQIMRAGRQVSGYFSDKERGNRRKGAALALGALGLAAAATVWYLESRGHGGVCLPPRRRPPSAGRRPPTGVPSVPPEVPVPPPAHLSLNAHEDSIWREVVGYAGSRGVRLDEGQKNHLVDQVLQANGQTRESARHLPVGYRFTLDPRFLDQSILKGYEDA